MASHSDLPTPEHFETIIADLLATRFGDTADYWRARVGGVDKLPACANSRCNWRANPVGSHDDLKAMEEAVEIARRDHPYVA